MKNEEDVLVRQALNGEIPLDDPRVVAITNKAHKKLIIRFGLYLAIMLVPTIIYSVVKNQK